MLRALILVYIALVFVSEIIDRKQKYSADEALKRTPTRAEVIAVDFRETPWIRRDGFVHTSFKFPSDKDAHFRTRGPPVEQEGKKTDAAEIKVPFTIMLWSRLSTWHQQPKHYAADDKGPNEDT